MEGNHTYEERKNMKMESKWGVEYYRAEKGRGQNVKRKTLSIFKESMHVYKEGFRIYKFPRVLISYNDFYIEIWKHLS